MAWCSVKKKSTRTPYLYLYLYLYLLHIDWTAGLFQDLNELTVLIFSRLKECEIGIYIIICTSWMSSF